MNRAVGTIIVSVLGFSAGIIAGMLLAPKSGRESRQWITEHAGEAKDWAEGQSLRIVKESEKRLHHITENLKENIPDLYEATEGIHFEDEELEDA